MPTIRAVFIGCGSLLVLALGLGLSVKGEAFPPGKKGDVGPELTGMGGRHPTDYLVESILNPNAVIVEAPGFTGPDGLSKMPDYRDSMTVAQLIDLVAYLKSLTGGDGSRTRPRHGH